MEEQNVKSAHNQISSVALVPSKIFLCWCLMCYWNMNCLLFILWFVITIALKFEYCILRRKTRERIPAPTKIVKWLQFWLHKCHQLLQKPFWTQPEFPHFLLYSDEFVPFVGMKEKNLRFAKYPFCLSKQIFFSLYDGFGTNYEQTHFISDMHF